MVDRGRGVGAGPGSFDVTKNECQAVASVSRGSQRIFRSSMLLRAVVLVVLRRRLCLGSWALLRPLCDCLWALPRLLLRLLGRPYAPCGCFVGGFAASFCVVRGAPFLLMLGLVGAPLPVGTSLPIVTPLLVAPLLHALSLLVAVLPLAPPLVVLQSAPAAHPG